MAAALAQMPTSSAYQQEMQRLRQRLGPPESGPLFSLRGIKLYMDGALGSRGAALSLPYSDEPQSSGLLLAPPEHIEAMAQWAIRNGYQVATHAIGDRANELVLRAYAQAGVKAPSNLRFRVEHAQVLPTSVVEQRRFAELGVIASVQPTHATSDMPWAESRLGPQRILNAYPWRSLLLSGARLVSGSDFPVEEADPRLTLHAAVTRRDVHGQPPAGWNPAQRLTVGEAIRTMTSDAAYAVFTEDRLGSLTIGRTADITLLGGSLSLDPSAPPPTDLVSRPVLLTVVGGRVVFDGLPRPSPPAPMKAKR
jgi:predicted amidohydrolase YtcJ